MDLMFQFLIIIVDVSDNSLGLVKLILFDLKSV